MFDVGFSLWAVQSGFLLMLMGGVLQMKTNFLTWVIIGVLLVAIGLLGRGYGVY